MSLLSQLFVSKKQVKSSVSTKAIVEQRTAELSDLSTEALIEAIESKSQPIDWQVDAIARLPYQGYLTGLITCKQNVKTYNAAILRVARLVDEGTVAFQQLETDLQSPLLSAGVASFCQDVDVLKSLIANIIDDALLATLASEGSTAKVRLAAADKLQNIEVIKPLVRQLKHKDKTVYRVLKDKLDAERRLQKNQVEIENQLQRICETLEALASKYQEPGFAGQLERIERKWNESVNAEIDALLLEKYQKALAACHAPAEKEKREKQIKNENAKRDNEAAEAYKKILDELGVFTATLFGAENSEESTSRAQQVTQQQKDAWGEIEKIAPAATVQNKALANAEQLMGRIITLIAESGGLTQNIEKLKIDEGKARAIIVVEQYLRCAKELPELALPSIISEAQALLSDIQKNKRKSIAAEKEHLRVIDGLVRKANAAIGHGSLRQACGIRKSLSEKIQSNEVLPVRLSRQLDELDEAIGKLQGYRDFSVEPKKLALIEKMQLLSEKSTSPEIDAESLANQIQKLQSDWKELVYGGKDMQPELWEQFQGLSRIAYKPCEVYFSVRADERKANLVLREALVSSFDKYLKDYSWETANWRDVEKVMRTAKQEWTSFSPVDRAANASLQKRFNHIVKSIQGLINIEYQKNSDAKQQIINSAEKLSGMEDIKIAIEQAKKLQTQWKFCGRTWPKEENKLWDAFRTHCDAVFTRKGEEVAAFKAELQAVKVQAELLCEKLEAILLLTGDELLPAKAQLKELSDAFDGLGILPKDSEGAIKARFSRAKVQFDTLLKDHRKNQKRLVWENIYTLNKLVNQWQESVLKQGKESEIAASILTEANEKIDTIEKWPAGTKTVIENKMAKELISVEALSENEKALRLLCVRMEIAADMPTPTEDQALRMEHQVGRLQQGMSGGAASKEDQISELLLEWLGASSVTSAIYDALWTRFSEQAL